MSHPNVTGTICARFGVTGYFSTTVKAVGLGKTEEMPMAFLGVEESFLGFFDIGLVAGRDFTLATMAEREAGEVQFILTESAVKFLGYAKASDAVGEPPGPQADRYIFRTQEVARASAKGVPGRLAGSWVLSRI